MAKETVAQRKLREANERALYLAEQEATYPQRLMALLQRAQASNYELDVKDMTFRLRDRDDRDYSTFELDLAYSKDADDVLQSLEWDVKAKEHQAAEAVRLENLARNAFNKLTKEEQNALGLNSRFNW